MTLRNAVYILIFALSVAAAFALDNPYGRMPLYILISLVLLSFCYALYVYNAFRFFENKSERTCTRGTVFHYRLHLANDARILFTHIRVVVFTGGEEIAKDFSLMPEKSEDYETDFLFRHIGIYDVGFLTAKIYDFLDIFSIRYQNYRYPVVVEPRIEKLEHLLAAKADDDPRMNTAFSRLKAESSGVYDGVREYIPGDSQRMIHWKLSDHTGKYMSRINRNTDSFMVSIYVDLYPTGLEREQALCVFDGLIETALAVANYGLERKCGAEFVYSSAGRIIVSDVADSAALRVLARKFALNSSSADFRVEELFHNNRQLRQSYDNVAVCTSNLSYDLVYYIAEMKNMGKNPMLFYIVPQVQGFADKGVMLEYLANRGIAVNFVHV